MPTGIDQLAILGEQAAAGAKKGADAYGNMADSIDKVDFVIKRASRSGVGWVNNLDNVTKATNRLSKAERDLVDAQEKINKAVKEGDVTQEQAARSIEAAQQRVEKFRAAQIAANEATKETSDVQAAATGQVKLAGYQMGILAEEAHKFFDQIIAGGSATKAAFYQLPNMVGVMGGLGNALSVLRGFMLGPGGVVAGGVALGAAFFTLAKNAEDSEERLASLSQRLRAVRDDYSQVAAASESAARAFSRSNHVSLPDARETINQFAMNPQIDSGQFQSLAKEAKDLAAETGQSVTDTAKQMTEAFDDPTKAAENFARQGMFGVHQALVQHIRDLQESGDKMGAWSTLMHQIGDASKDAAENGLTPFQKAWENFKNSFNNSPAIENIKSIFGVVGKGLLNTGTMLLGGDYGGNYKEHQDWLARTNPASPVNQNSGSTANISSLIDRVGSQLNLPSDLNALAHRLAGVESSTGQYDRRGQLVRSSAGAIGAMQVMPDNAGDQNLASPMGNVTASEKLLIRLYDKYSGNQRLVAMAYNWGEGNVDKYLSGKQPVPSSVVDYADKVTGGQTFSAVQVAQRQGRVDTALQAPESGVAAQIKEQNNAITQITSAQKALNDLHDAGKTSDADYAQETAALTARLTQHRAALLELRDPMEALAHQQNQSIQLAGASTAAQRAMIQTDQQVEEAVNRLGQAHASTAEKMAAEAQQQRILSASFDAGLKTITGQTSAQKDLIAAYDASQGPLATYLLRAQALQKVQATSLPGTAEQARQVEALTKALKDQDDVQKQTQLAGSLFGQQQDLNYIKEETALLGQNQQAASQRLTVLKATQELEKQGINTSSATAQQYLANISSISAATQEYNRQKSAIDDLTGSISEMADTISSSLTNAIMQGSGSFKNALSGIQSQLASFFVKRTFMNPLLNMLDGGSRTSLLGGLGSLFGGTSSAAAATSTSGNAVASSAANAARSSTSVFGGGAAGTNFMSSSLFNGVSGSDLFSGVGMGFGAGNLIGLIGGNQKGGMIGSGIGSLVGTGIGSIFGPAGAQIGGLIGGTGGGLLGGLFSKKKANWDTVSGMDGRLGISEIWLKHSSDKVTSGLQQNLKAINNLYDDTGLSVADGDYGEVGFTKKGGKVKDQTNLEDILGSVRLKSSDSMMQQALDSVMPSSFDSVQTYSSTVQSIHSLVQSLEDLHISVKSFDDMTHVTVDHVSGYTGDLDKALNNTLDGKKWNTSDLTSKANEIISFVNDTEKSLLDVTNSGTQSIMQQVDALQQKYKKAADQAKSYGLDAQQFLDRGNEIAQKMISDQQGKLNDNSLSVKARYMTVTGDDQDATLLNFDVSASQQRKALADSWRDFVGDSYATNRDYLSQQAELEKTLGAERLQIQKQYTGQSLQQEKEYRQQAQQSIASTYSSLADYVRGLDTSDASPLSVEGQFKTSQSSFSSDYNAAMGGDYDALNRIQNDAQTYLANSQKYLGSGADYAKLYSDLTDKLKNLASADQDKLTSQFMEKLSKQQINATQQVKDAVENLKKAVDDLARNQRLQNLTDATRPR